MYLLYLCIVIKNKTFFNYKKYNIMKKLSYYEFALTMPIGLSTEVIIKRYLNYSKK